ncbi:hypothetical protein ACEUZ9_000484 [Paracoccus litorisediminis]
MTAPKHEIRLEEKNSPHHLERRPRYDVLLNGVKVDQLYYKH